MANEYLKRTPTSTGNRKVFTWAGWVKTTKESKSGNGNDIFFCASSNDTGSTVYHRTRIGKYVQTEHDFGFNHYDGANDNYASKADFRDFSSWSHYLCSVDTTKEQATDRVKIYVNGAHINDFETVTAINQNLDTFVNGLTVHYVGADGWTASPNTIAKISMFDVFFVDGQTLTPDVFGYYKKGDGYISAGSTQATDFKRGQWVPKAPKVIKSVINARGGFGVNGFYLPMNDSTNFGADLHCTPNSIIKLKGEDEPQPYYGAPTTTDAYVSQLRSDPYAANLVLAVPGIHINLIENGTFDTNTTGWTAYNSVISSEDGQLKVDDSANVGGWSSAVQVVPTVVGESYTLSVDIGTGTEARLVGIFHGTYTTAGTAPSIQTGTYTTEQTVTHTFTATNTTTSILLTMNNDGVGYFDNVKLSSNNPRDFSADIKGSGTNKTLTANGSAHIDSDHPSYYGSAMSFDGNDDNFDVASNGNDYLIGQNDFTIEGWYYSVSHASTGHHKRVWYLGGELNDSISLNINGTDADLEYRYNDGVVLTSGVTIPTGQWVHIVLERYNRRSYIYVNGKISANGADSNYLDYTAYNFRIGQNASTNANGPASSLYGYAQDVRFYNGVAKYKGVGFDIVKPYTPVGIESWRAVPDTTANNFATFNPLMISSNGTNTTYNQYTLTNGNLSAAPTANNHGVSANFSVSSGKWYWEMRVDTFFADNLWMGILDHNFGGGGTTPLPVDSNYWYTAENAEINFYGSGGTVYRGSSTTATGTTYAATDIIGFGLDLDTDGNTTPRLSFYKNGTLAHTSTGSMSGEPIGLWRPAVTFGGGGTDWLVTANFGQNPTFSGNTTAGTYTDGNGKGLFKYQPPSGFLALCEDNLPTPAIANPGKYFKTVLYTGSSSARAITGVGFKPDLVWIKKRSTAGDHKLIDSVRGAGLILESNTTDIEGDETGNFSGFSNDGFDLTATTAGAWNESPYNYVAWCWKAGGAAVSNTDGTITSQVSANQTAGFSIVSYTGNATSGATVGHGLSKTPAMIIVKNRDSVKDWPVWHRSLTPTTGTLWLDLTVSQTTYQNRFSSTSFTSDVFALGSSSSDANDSGDRFIAYCWTEIEGFSKFGSYVGNASVDGTFVYCGFKPAFILLKPSSYSSNWVIADSSRSSTNGNTKWLYPDLSYLEEDGAGRYIDLLSNGFKIRNGSSGTNTSGGTIIFAAFAESPFTTANAK